MTTNAGRLSDALPRPYESHAPSDARPGSADPVLASQMAGVWLNTSWCILRITHRSSAHFCKRGSESQISMPLRPQRVKVCRLPMSFCFFTSVNWSFNR